jgi:hypothetical protein
MITRTLASTDAAKARSVCATWLRAVESDEDESDEDEWVSINVH